METSANTQLLILADADANAEQVVNLLRRAGLAVHASQTRTTAELADMLAHRQWDLLLLMTSLDKVLELNLVDLLQQADKDIPVLLLSPGLPAPESFTGLLDLGISDVLDVTDLDNPLTRSQLWLSVRRELGNLRQRRTRRRLSASFRELEKRYQLLLASAFDAISYLQDGVHVYANGAYMELFAYENVQDMVSIPLLDLVAEEDIEAVKLFLRGRSKDTSSCTFKALRKDGSAFNAVMDAAVVPYEGRRALQLVIKPATGNPELKNTVRQIHHRDLLTGLLNRSSLFSQIELAISDAVYDNKAATLVLLQLRHLEDVTVVIGRSASNLLLADVGAQLQALLPDEIMVGRVAANEFAVLLPDASEQHQAQAETLLEDLNRGLLPLIPQSLQLYAVLGVAAVNGEASDAEVIIERARHNIIQRERDRQLAQGRKNFVSTKEVLKMLKKALHDGRFVLAFQPIVSLKTDGVEHYEVRIRMHNQDQMDDKALIYPPDFLEIANQHGLGEEIDHWVIQQVLEIFRQRENPKLRLTVNLTQNSMSSDTLLPWLAAQLHDYRQIADQLVLQISELDTVSAPSKVASFCSRVHELNLRLSVAHFGCSLNPFQHLADTHAHYVKLDRALLDQINVDFEQREKLHATVSALHAQGALVIAPMIDQIELLPLLWQANVNMVQGNCLQEPSENMNFDFMQDEEITLGSYS